MNSAVTTTTTKARGGTVYSRRRKFSSETDSGLGLGNGTLLLTEFDSGTELGLLTVAGGELAEVVRYGDTAVVCRADCEGGRV